MEWFLDRLWEQADRSGNLAAIIYAAYLSFILFLARSLAQKYSWKEYLQIPRWRNSIIIIVLLPAIVIGVFFYESARWDEKLPFIVSLLLFAGAFIWNLLKRKSSERRKMDECFEKEKDFLEVYWTLEQIDEKKLTPEEKKLLKKRKYYILYELGSMKKAASLMREVEAEDSPEYFLFSAIEQEKAGNIEKAEQCMRQAWNKTGNTKADHHTRVQVLNDYGRCYRISGNFREAVTYYKQAVKELCFPEDEKLAHPIYTNYIFTLCMLKPPEWELAQNVLEEYKGHLDMDSMEDRITYQNVKLEMMRQMNKTEECRKLIDEGFDDIMNMKLSDEQRLVFEATHLRVAHTGNANFIAPLETIRKDLAKFKELKMPQRYWLIKEIHILFRPETPASAMAIEYYKDVKEFANEYIIKQARQDIEEYLRRLPADAVYLRGKLQEELVGISHYENEYPLKHYSFERNKELMLSARNIYESNGLVLEAMKVSLNLADECFLMENLDEELMPKNIVVLQEALSYAENILQRVLFHPECAEDFARIAWMYVRIHQYDKCGKYMELYNKCNLTSAHYAPWLRKLTWAAHLMKHILELEKRIEDIQRSPEKLQDLSPEAREWLKNYPENVDSLEVSLLWGGLLDYEQVFVKRKVWLGVDGQTGEIGPKVHHWLCIQEFYPLQCITITILEIDMKYRFLQQGGTPKKMFLANMHPMENGKDVLMRQDQEDTHMTVQNVQGFVYPFPHMDKEGRRTKLEELRKYIQN